jgi:hypothetical protein
MMVLMKYVEHLESMQEIGGDLPSVTLGGSYVWYLVASPMFLINAILLGAGLRKSRRAGKQN